MRATAAFAPLSWLPRRRSLARVAGCAAGALNVITGAVVSAGLLGAVALDAAREWAGPVSLERIASTSSVVVDREGRLLRAFTAADGRWRLPVETGDVDPRYLAMLKAFEDRRFDLHRGVDPIAIARAGVQMVTHGRMVSGASTLTMQVARLLLGRHERTADGKLRQMMHALELEQRLTKSEILSIYLKLAPFGGNIEGVRAASLAYFGKEPTRLSLGEAALLVALPQSPERRRPDRGEAAGRTARARVLDVAVDAGLISRAEADRAAAEPLPSGRVAFPLIAAHLAEQVAAEAPDTGVHRLTLDRDVQVRLERLARSHALAEGRGLSAAVVVADHATGAVLAYVGAADYLDMTRSGPIDMVRAVRSPGSTLKPITYALAFDLGLAHPETLIEDRPTRFGSYAPKNFDEDYRGTITVREALAASLNVPAVKMLAAVGPGRLVGRLEKVGLKPQLPDGVEPALPVALGGVGLTLMELTELYGGLARGGSIVRLTYKGGQAFDGRAGSVPLVSDTAAYYVTSILKDAPPPPNARGGRIAYKTGTSYGYRDAWAIGYDGRHVIGVWMGRADGGSVPGLIGRQSAAPLLFDAFHALGTRLQPFEAAPASALTVRGAELPGPLKRFGDPLERSAGALFIERPVRIAFPPDRSEVALEDSDGHIVLKAEGGALPLTWMVDGAPIEASDLATHGHGRSASIKAGGSGFHTLAVIDAKGRTDRVTVRLTGP